MTKSFIKILLLLLWLLLPTKLTSANLQFNNVPINGATTVLCVAQDDRGLIWIGTDAGLYSYDGYRTFPHFTLGTRANSRVHTLTVIGERIYLGSDNGLLVYDRQTDNYSDAPAASVKDIRSLLADGDEIILGGSDGLSIVSKKDAANAKPLHVALPNVYSLLKTGNRRYLVGTIGGLYAYENGKAKAVKIGDGKQPLVNALAMVDERYPSLGCWIGTEGALYRFRNGRFDRLSQLDGNSIKSIDKATDCLYVGTDDGLYRLGTDGRVSRYTHDSRHGHSIANNIVWAVKQLPDGIFCAGTDNGLSISRSGEACQILALSAITDTGDGNTIHAMLHEPDGTMWMGGTNGLIRCNMTITGEVVEASQVAWYKPGGGRFSLPHNRVRKIFRDREGDLVVCTDHGVNVLDRRTGQFRNYIVSDKTGHYTTAWAYDVVEDAQGRYWIAAYMGGVFVVDKKKMLASGGRLVADRHFSNELQGIHVSQLAMDGNMRVWLRIYDGGTDIIDTRTMKVQHRLKDTSDFLAQDIDGGIVLAHGGCVERFTADGKSLATYPINVSTSGHIDAMTVVNNSLWVLTGRTCRVFQTDGMSRQFVVPGKTAQSMYSDPAMHSVLFGFNDGLTVVDAEVLNNASSQSVRLAFTGIEVNGQPWKADGISALFAEQLSLASDENNVRLCLSDIPYRNSVQQVYVYKLEGIDRVWQQLSGDDLSIVYNALPYGNYHLQVCVADGQGNPGSEVYGISITVRPPWYLSVWAKMLFVFILIGLLLWAMNSYMVRERLRKERLERRQIMEQSDARAAFFNNLSRQLKSPVGRILASLYALLPDEKDSSRRQSINNARRDATLINELVVRSLDIQGREDKGNDSTADKVRINLTEFCRRTVDDLRPSADKLKAELRFKTDTPLMFITLDLVRFSPLFRSLISFASEHANPQGTVTCTVSAGHEDRTASVIVTIDGWILPQDQLPFVFYRYGMPQTGANDTQNEGINQLSLLKDYAEQQGGSISVNVNEDIGTTFTLILTSCEAMDAKKNDELSHIPAKAISVSADTADSHLLAKITQAVESHISDSELNVSRLQELVGLGDKLLYRRIKQMTGRTPVEFIRHIRMQRASMLLREGKFTVSEVMYMVGFSNTSYFSKCFQKVYGITPAEYQRKVKY